MIDEEEKEKVDGVNGVMDLVLSVVLVAEMETISWFLGGYFPMSSVSAKGTSSLSLKETSWFKFTFKLLQHFVVTTTFDWIISSVFIVTEVGDKVVQ